MPVLELSIDNKHFMNHMNIHGVDPDWESQVASAYANIGLYVEVLDQFGRCEFSGSINSTSPKAIHLPTSGNFTAIAYLPSGDVKTEVFKLSPEQHKVATIELQHSKSEDLSFETFLGVSDRIGEHTFVPEDVEIQPWIFESGKWSKTSLSYTQIHHPLFLKFRFAATHSYVPYCLSVKANGCTQSIILSTFFPCELLLLADENDDLKTFRMTLNLISHNPNLELFFNYLKAGNLRAAKVLAKKLLFEKVQDPAGAALGAYFGLLYGGNKHLDKWSQNLANWFPQVIDGNVVQGKLFLNRKEKQKSLEYFSRVFASGLPLYSYGMRILVDSLRMFPENAEARKMCADLIQYTDCLDWQSVSTSFTGDPRPRFYIPRSESKEQLNRYLVLHGYERGDYAPERVSACKETLFNLLSSLKPVLNRVTVIGGWSLPFLADDIQLSKTIGSVDIDLLIDTQSIDHLQIEQLEQLIKNSGFYKSNGPSNSNQFWKRLNHDGQFLSIRLDLLSANSALSYEHIGGIVTRYAPGSELALTSFRSKEIVSTNGSGVLKVNVASPLAMFVMKAHAFARKKPKDAVDIEFLCKNFDFSSDIITNFESPFVGKALLTVMQAFLSGQEAAKHICDFEGLQLNAAREQRKNESVSAIRSFYESLWFQFLVQRHSQFE